MLVEWCGVAVGGEGVCMACKRDKCVMGVVKGRKRLKGNGRKDKSYFF